ncbi:MAG: hypothetical protein ABIH20_04960 [Candidatus Diapherotrites archaeon]
MADPNLPGDNKRPRITFEARMEVLDLMMKGADFGMVIKWLLKKYPRSSRDYLIKSFLGGKGVLQLGNLFGLSKKVMLAKKKRMNEFHDAQSERTREIKARQRVVREKQAVKAPPAKKKAPVKKKAAGKQLKKRPRWRKLDYTVVSPGSEWASKKGEVLTWFKNGRSINSIAKNSGLPRETVSAIIRERIEDWKRVKSFLERDKARNKNRLQEVRGKLRLLRRK